MIALDTNLLVYAHRARTPQHRRARKAIEQAASTAAWGVSLSSVTEFWAVVTHPLAEGQPSTPTEARAFVSALIEAGAHIWQPGPGFAARVMQLAEELRIVGPRIFDLQIGLAAFEGGALELWTHDARFARVPGLRVLDPLGP